MYTNDPGHRIQTCNKGSDKIMFKKLHMHLTILFTVISMLIMTSMSVLYIILDYKSIYKNTLYGFKSNISTITSNFENKTSISYNTLLNFQNSYNYLFFVYDNNIPFQFTTDTKTKEQLNFINNFKQQECSKNPHYLKRTYTTVHNETIYKSGKNQYLIGTITIPGDKSNTDIYIVSLITLKQQKRQILVRFSLIIISTTLALFIFSWFFTRRLLRPIQENQQSQSRFIVAASHEIRNPVNTIAYTLNAISKADETDRMKFISIGKKEAKRLSLLTNDLLMLARSDSHSFKLLFHTTDLDTLILDSYEAFLLPAREKKINLSVELPEESLSTEKTDPERIREVIAILIDNAISYTNEGGKIILRCSQTSKEFIIEVIDNGPGIADSDKRNIFERFYRADKSRENNSHFGLGLCIANEIIKLHGGNITVKDTEGGGSTFVVTLYK